jgi:uncharacterized OB-fold protein
VSAPTSGQGTGYEKPLPVVTTLTKPFWDYCSQHELRMQYCKDCNEWVWYPKALCPSCGKRTGIEWRQMSGKGKVYSFTIIRQVVDNSPAFNKDLPFAVGVIELEEGPRIYSNLTGANPEEISIGNDATVYFEDVAPGISLPKFSVSR